MIHKNKVNFFYSVENDPILYWRAEQKYRKYSKMMTITLLVYDQFAYVSTFISSIYWISIGNCDASTWPVLFDLSVPFDSKTICGWYLQMLFAACMDLAFLICMLHSTIHFIGCCIYMAAICEHFDLIMRTIQATVEHNLREKSPRKCSDNKAKINAQIREAIQIHVKIYE